MTKSIVKKLFLIILGLFLVSWIIYSRFIRERLPKDIPFFLTEIRFWILVYICCIYLYLIIQLIISLKKEITYQKAFTTFLDILYMPLTMVDHLLKYNKYFGNYYCNLMYNFIEFLALRKEKQLIIMLLFFQIIPRCILISLLTIDIFYFNEIKIFYKVILLGLLPVIHRYMKYSIKDLQKYYIKKLALRYEKVLMFDANYKMPDRAWEITEYNKYHDELIPLQEFFDFKIGQVTFTQSKKADYMFSPQLKEELYEEYRKKITGSDDPSILIPQRNLDILKQDFEYYLDKILFIAIFYQHYSNMDQHKSIKVPKIIIFCLYLICWLFILIISYFHFPIELKMLKIFISNMVYYIIKYNDQILDVYQYTVINYVNKSILILILKKIQIMVFIKTTQIELLLQIIIMIIILYFITNIFITEQLFNLEAKNNAVEIVIKTDLGHKEKKYDPVNDVLLYTTKNITELSDAELFYGKLAYKKIMEYLECPETKATFGISRMYVFNQTYFVEQRLYTDILMNAQYMKAYLNTLNYSTIAMLCEDDEAEIIDFCLDMYMETAFNECRKEILRWITEENLSIIKENSYYILYTAINEIQFPSNIPIKELNQIKAPEYIQEIIDLIDWPTIMLSTPYADNDHTILTKIYTHRCRIIYHQWHKEEMLITTYKENHVLSEMELCTKKYIYKAICEYLKKPEIYEIFGFFKMQIYNKTYKIEKAWYYKNLLDENLASNYLNKLNYTMIRKLCNYDQAKMIDFCLEFYLRENCIAAAKIEVEYVTEKEIQRYKKMGITLLNLIAQELKLKGNRALEEVNYVTSKEYIQEIVDLIDWPYIILSNSPDINILIDIYMHRIKYKL